MVLSLLSSLIIVIIGNYIPSVYSAAASIVESIDFNNLIMKMMLSFLLFAGSIHINSNNLKEERATVFTLATIGVIISTCIVGVLLFFVVKLFGLDIKLIYCLLFGSLISPTDPIAVLGILKEAKIPKKLELKISCESLFNDGVAVVIFLSILNIAQAGIENLSFTDIGLLFIKEAIGGVVYGALLGYLGFIILRSIDNYKVETLITIAIVMGGYALADLLHISGPLAMVMAGLIIGNSGKKLAMSATTRDYLDKFWELVDEILNAILFLLIGFEILVVKINSILLLVGVATIVIVLIARFISVALPVSILGYRKTFEKNTIPILTWGGLRGGLSVALALSLPEHMHREQFVSITYIVVIFSIIVQGLTIGKFARKLSIY
jgi:CPA1 family monovalent cation:H+ antiporter